MELPVQEFSKYLQYPRRYWSLFEKNNASFLSSTFRGLGGLKQEFENMRREINVCHFWNSADEGGP